MIASNDASFACKTIQRYIHQQIKLILIQNVAECIIESDILIGFVRLFPWIAFLFSYFIWIYCRWSLAFRVNALCRSQWIYLNDSKQKPSAVHFQCFAVVFPSFVFCIVYVNCWVYVCHLDRESFLLLVYFTLYTVHRAPYTIHHIHNATNINSTTWIGFQCNHII